MLAQNGGSFFNADKTQATFNDAKGVEAATWLIDKANNDHVMPTTAELGGQDDTALFKSGKLAMWHNGIWQFTGLKDAPFAWDVQVEPGNVAKAHHFFANAVVASAATRRIRPRRSQWLSFLTGSPEAVKTRLDASWELPAVADQSLFAELPVADAAGQPGGRVRRARRTSWCRRSSSSRAQMQDIVTKALAVRAERPGDGPGRAERRCRPGQRAPPVVRPWGLGGPPRPAPPPRLHIDQGTMDHARSSALAEHSIEVIATNQAPSGRIRRLPVVPRLPLLVAARWGVHRRRHESCRTGGIG